MSFSLALCSFYFVVVVVEVLIVGEPDCVQCVQGAVCQNWILEAGAISVLPPTEIWP
jgi:hypothetical protein